MDLRVIIYTLAFIQASNLFSQTSNVLNSYISEGLQNNLTLKQKQLTYQQSLEELTMARGKFFPEIGINARYTVADGGRLIEFPVGDLLNPVYSTLHQLTGNMPPSQQFPDMQVENQDFRFYRPTEHETKIHVMQPVFYPQIYHNHQIKKQLADLGKIDEQSFERQLVAEIKMAYFNYLKTLELEQVLKNSRDLIKENIRVNQSLYENEKVTIDNVYKAEAELQKIEQQEALLKKNKQATKGFFNFLLNKPLDSDVIIDSEFVYEQPPNNLDTAKHLAIENSKDIEALNISLDIAGKNIDLQKSSFLPTVSAVIDYGFQGETYAFTSEDDFVLASLVLQWEIFKGKQNRSKVQKAKINQEIQQVKLEQAKSSIELSVVNLFYEVDAERKQISAIEKQNQANEKVFEVVRKKYNQGRANMLEFTDAQTAFQNSSQQLAIARYNYYILLAELEKTLGLFNKSTVAP